MSLKKYLRHLLKNKKSLIAFNIQDTNHLQPLSKACCKIQKKVICQFSKRYFLYLDRIVNFPRLINFYKKKNIFFFLDHCDDIEVIKKCIKYNFDGIMYDGSKEKLAVNILKTNEIRKLTKKNNCLLEAEIGPIHGSEDGFKSAKKKLKKDELINFIKNAKFDLLAIGAGNTHGLYSKINIDEKLYSIATSQRKKIKLVFHGGSAVNSSFLRKIQKNNIVKINISSSLKKEMNKLYSSFSKKNDTFDIIEFHKYSENHLINFFHHYMKVYS
jgi:fructose/tagatose bisphosphate aldolase